MEGQAGFSLDARTGCLFFSHPRPKVLLQHHIFLPDPGACAETHEPMPDASGAVPVMVGHEGSLFELAGAHAALKHTEAVGSWRAAKGAHA